MKTNFRNALSAEFVRSCLNYDHESGVLTWKHREDIQNRINTRLAGKVAGVVSKQNGYTVIGLCGETYLAHRLVWLIVTGEWPDSGVDHRDRNKQNNRFINLRQASQSPNMANRPKQKNNKSGFKGVSFQQNTGRWFASIMVNKKTIGLGRFSNKEDAAAAYDAAAENFFGSFACGNNIQSN